MSLSVLGHKEIYFLLWFGVKEVWRLGPGASCVEVLQDQRERPWDQPSRTSHPWHACIIRKRDGASERVEGMTLDTLPDWGASQSQHTLQVGKAQPQKMMRLESRDGTGPEYLSKNGAQKREIKSQSGRGSQPQWAVASDSQATIWLSLWQDWTNLTRTQHPVTLTGMLKPPIPCMVGTQEPTTVDMGSKEQNLPHSQEPGQDHNRNQKQFMAPSTC